VAQAAANLFHTRHDGAVFGWVISIAVHQYGGEKEKEQADWTQSSAE